MSNFIDSLALNQERQIENLFSERYSSSKHAQCLQWIKRIIFRIVGLDSF